MANDQVNYDCSETLTKAQEKSISFSFVSCFSAGESFHAWGTRTFPHATEPGSKPQAVFCDSDQPDADWRFQQPPH